MHVFQHFNKLTPKEQGRVRSSIRVTELEAPRERAETEVLSTETFFSKTLFFSEIYCWITAAMNSRNRIYNTAVSINSRKNTGQLASVRTNIKSRNQQGKAYLPAWKNQHIPARK